jgi:hypothetical protein
MNFSYGINMYFCCVFHNFIVPTANPIYENALSFPPFTPVDVAGSGYCYGGG